ncbi:MAG: 5'-phosphate synthase pdxT subunit [Nitriliruptoraceae bacterium]
MVSRSWIPGERLAGRSSVAPWERDDLPDDAPRVGVLALQGDVLEHLAALARVGAKPSQVRQLAHLDDVDALVIPGGESTTIGKLLGLTGLLEPLRARVAAGFPIFGTCAGMIVLADDLEQDKVQPLVGGLGVQVRRNAFGRQRDSFDTTLDVAGVGAMDASFIRAPWVSTVLADDVEILATVRDHGVVVRRGALLASSFHPEVTGDDRLHALFVKSVRAR